MVVSSSNLLEYFIFLIGLISSFLVGGNNSAIALGILVSTNVLRRRLSYLINAISLFSGASIGSITMESSIYGLVSSQNFLLLEIALSAILFSSTVTFYYLNKIGIPASLSQMIYPSLASVVLIARGTIGFDWGKFDFTVLSWILSPLVAIATSLSMYFFLRKFLKSKRNFIREIRYYKYGLIISSIFTSFVTGANAIGIIISAGLLSEPFYITAPIYATAASLGIYLSSRKAVITVGFRITRLGYTAASSALIGSDIISEVFTIFGVPISITQTIMGGIIGLSLRSFGYDVQKQLKQIAKGWVVSPMLAMIVSLATYGILRSILGL
ncbi:inorganic phosphate transporter [Stygiolobus azoricus]|uniref:Inorganic phosphate transporter n=1 Tax=Stygiolobus azoricus TaxID=41675 RepID=A0A650CLL5_9CREN|nr:inorganic phosphate transporter [Stygiolobus azoricus]QGR18746.1 inorganic phosphate transporter [Stygiolobus azoricus]